MASLVFERWRIPDVILLLAAGVILGPLTGFVDASAFEEVATPFATLALIVILFEGGLDLRVSLLRKRLGLTSALLMLSYFATALGVMVAARLVLDWPWAVSLLAGLVLAPLSSSIAIPLAARLKVIPATRAILTVESALGDVLAVLAVTIAAGAIAGETASGEAVGRSLASSLFLGAVVAGAIGLAWLSVLRFLEGRPYAYLATFAMSVLLFGLVEAFQGNGVVAVLVFALVLGNADEIAQKLPLGRFKLDPRIKWFHAEMSFFVRTFFFLYLGLSVSKSALTVSTILAGLAIVGAIVLVRGSTVWVLVRQRPEERADASYLTFLLGRGLASAALATLPLVGRAVGPYPVADVAFAVILLSNLAMTVFLLVKEGGFGAGADLDATLSDLAFAAEEHARLDPDAGPATQ